MQMKRRWMRTHAFQIASRKARKKKCEQRWKKEVQSKKTLDLHTVYSSKEADEGSQKKVNNPGDRRGARLKFRFRARSAGLRAEVGGWTVCDVQ